MTDRPSADKGSSRTRNAATDTSATDTSATGTSATRTTDARTTAARTVAGVLDGRSLDDMLVADHWQLLPSADRALARELAIGTVRFHAALAADVSRFLREPLAERDNNVWALLLVGAYQLRHTRVPDHAAVSTAVAAAKGLRRRWAPGLINAVLRQLTRSPEPPPHVNHPDWLLSRMKDDHPYRWRDLAAVNDTRAPMCLRVNPRRSSVRSAALMLSEHSLTCRPGGLSDQALILDRPVPAAELPHAGCGAFAIQDEGAQLAGPLLLDGLLARGPADASAAADAQLHILDACAAPGGKAMHLLELAPRANLTLLDADADRLDSTRVRLADRPGNCRYVVADASARPDWWDGRQFDAILADVPCSGTGSIRRNPDIRLLRRSTDITPMAQRQLAILLALWPLLAPGGQLLYCTCSVLAEENQDVIAAFLQRCPEARADSLDVPWGHPRGDGRELLPAVDANDGFYFARLRHAQPQDTPAHTSSPAP